MRSGLPQPFLPAAKCWVSWGQNPCDVGGLRHMGKIRVTPLFKGWGWNGDMGIVFINCSLKPSRHRSHQSLIIFQMAFYDSRQEGAERQQRGNYYILREQFILMWMPRQVHSATGRAIGRLSDIYWTMGPNNHSENRILQYWLEQSLIPLSCEDDSDRILKPAVWNPWPTNEVAQQRKTSLQWNCIFSCACEKGNMGKALF